MYRMLLALSPTKVIQRLQISLLVLLGWVSVRVHGLVHVTYSTIAMNIAISTQISLPGHKTGTSNLMLSYGLSHVEGYLRNKRTTMD